jgi:RNA polymerase subunit RPABC4/transcription elongation factor Spt4
MKIICSRCKRQLPSGSCRCFDRVRPTDFTFENHGSIWIVQPHNSEAREHLAENVSDEAIWFAGGLAVEPRYVEDLAEGLQENGFRVSF